MRRELMHRGRQRVTTRIALVGGVSILVGAVMFSGLASARSTQAPNLAAARAQLAKYTGIPKFKAPGPAFNAKKIMQGKHIVAIPVISANPFTTFFEAAQAKIAKEIGFKYTRWENKGTVAEWAKGIDYAISQKASLIALDGASQPRLLGPQIAKARKAGIIVIDTHETDTTQGKSPYVNFTIPAPYTESGELMADHAIVDTKGKANALIITSSDVIGSPPFVRSIQNTFKKNCPACKSTVVNVTVADWSTKLGPTVIGAIQKNPNLNYIIPIYDPETQFVVPALRQAGKLGKIKIATYAGTPFVLEDIAKGWAQMDVAENLDWVGYAMLDDEMRLIAGMKPVFPEYIALRVITKANVGNGKDNLKLYGTDVGKGWRKLWGLPAT
jgi:ribose transport system substrate-binding protein